MALLGQAAILADRPYDASVVTGDGVPALMPIVEGCLAFDSCVRWTLKDVLVALDAVKERLVVVDSGERCPLSVSDNRLRDGHAVGCDDRY